MVQQIAHALELPSPAPLEDKRQMIEGKLKEREQEPQNIQVVVVELADQDTSISLRDESGVFLEVPSPPEHGGTPVRNWRQ